MRQILLYFVKILHNFFDKPEAFKIPGNSRPRIETAPTEFLVALSKMCIRVIQGHYEFLFVIVTMAIAQFSK